MKKSAIIAIILTVGLFAPSCVQGQGTVYFSNLGQTSTGSWTVGSDMWISASFVTGTNSGGYNLNSIQLLTVPATGSPSNFSVSVYTHSAIFQLPGSSLGGLTGPDPGAGGTFTYASSGIALTPSTLYFVVLTSATPVANGVYNWSYTSSSSYTSTSGWSFGSYRNTSSDGLVWGRTGGIYFQFGVNASAVPEPSTFALAGLGLVCLICCRKGVTLEYLH